MATYRYYILAPAEAGIWFTVSGWARTEDSAVSRVDGQGRVVYASTRDMALRRAIDGKGKGTLVWAPGVGVIAKQDRVRS